MKTITLYGCAALALACAGPAVAKGRASDAFVTKAIQGNLAEIQMGQLAQEKGQSDGVKSFGQMLVKDHTDANTKASALASQEGVAVPTEPTAKQKADAAKMSKLSGTAFDRQFAKHMIMDHKMDIRDYRKAARAKDAAGAYASETLPTLENHLQAAQSLAEAK